MIDKFKISLLLGFITAFFTYSLWFKVKEWLGVQIFYQGIALAFVCYTYAIHVLLTRNTLIKNRRFWCLVSNVIYLTALNSLVDELLFDPTKFSINEYVGFILIILIAAYNHEKQRYNEY